MRKRILGVVAALAWAAVFPGALAQSNQIDAATAATSQGRSQVYGGKAFGDSAQIYFAFNRYRYSPYQIKWDSLSTTTFKHTQTIAGHVLGQRDTVTIRPLAKKTLYHAQLYGKTTDNGYRDTYTNFSFTTVGTTMILLPRAAQADVNLPPRSTIKFVGSDGRVVRTIRVAQPGLMALQAISDYVHDLPVGNYHAVVESARPGHVIHSQNVTICR